jgi:hypothetical protein
MTATYLKEGIKKMRATCALLTENYWHKLKWEARKQLFLLSYKK